MKASSARSQKIQVVTASDYLEFMKCPLKVHGSVLSERLFHDIPSCSPPTSTTRASGHAPPGPPPVPLVPTSTPWSAPVIICKSDKTKNPWGTLNEPLNEICSPPSKISKAEKNSTCVGDATAKVSTGFWDTLTEPMIEICSPPTKVSKAEKNSNGVGDATAKVVTGFNIEQSFRRLSCEENNDPNENKGKQSSHRLLCEENKKSNENKGNINVQSLNSVKVNQKENIITEISNQNENISHKKENNTKSSINYAISNKTENITEICENGNPWITVKTKPGAVSQPKNKTNKENKAIPPSSFQSQLAKQLSDGAKKLPSPSEDFNTKFALRLLQTQPQIQQQQQQKQSLQKQPHQKQSQQKQSQQKQQQPRPQKEKRQSPKQKIDKKENCDALRGSPKLQWRNGGQRDPRFQPEWRMSMEHDSHSKSSNRSQQLLRKRTRSESTNAIAIGTRIIYERKFLMQCRASPLAKTPPANLPNIPGITTKDSEVAPPRENGTIPEEPEKTDVDDDQFEMDL